MKLITHCKARFEGNHVPELGSGGSGEGAWYLLAFLLRTTGLLLLSDSMVLCTTLSPVRVDWLMDCCPRSCFLRDTFFWLLMDSLNPNSNALSVSWRVSLQSLHIDIDKLVAELRKLSTALSMYIHLFCCKTSVSRYSHKDGIMRQFLT